MICDALTAAGAKSPMKRAKWATKSPPKMTKSRADTRKITRLKAENEGLRDTIEAYRTALQGVGMAVRRQNAARAAMMER
jgi:hypothetical protein